MDKETARLALAIDPAWLEDARKAWITLIELCVLGDVRSSRLGVLGKLRKRALEVGERLGSLGADRAWIPHPREQLKSALAAALHFRESVQQLLQCATAIDNGRDVSILQSTLGELQRLIEALPQWENRWATLLDSQLSEPG